MRIGILLFLSFYFFSRILQADEIVLQKHPRITVVRTSPHEFDFRGEDESIPSSLPVFLGRQDVLFLGTHGARRGGFYTEQGALLSPEIIVNGLSRIGVELRDYKAAVVETCFGSCSRNNPRSKKLATLLGMPIITSNGMLRHPRVTDDFDIVLVSNSKGKWVEGDDYWTVFMPDQASAEQKEVASAVHASLHAKVAESYRFLRDMYAEPGCPNMFVRILNRLLAP